MKSVFFLASTCILFFTSCKKNKETVQQPAFEAKLIQHESIKSNTGLAHFVFKFSVTSLKSDAKFSTMVTMNRYDINEGVQAVIISDDADMLSKTSLVLTHIDQSSPVAGYYLLDQAHTRTFVMDVFVSNLVKDKMYRVVISRLKVVVDGKYYDIDTDDWQTSYVVG